MQNPPNFWVLGRKKLAGGYRKTYLFLTLVEVLVNTWVVLPVLPYWRLLVWANRSKLDWVMSKVRGMVKEGEVYPRRQRWKLRHLFYLCTVGVLIWVYLLRDFCKLMWNTGWKPLDHQICTFHYYNRSLFRYYSLVSNKRVFTAISIFLQLFLFVFVDLS